MSVSRGNGFPGPREQERRRQPRRDPHERQSPHPADPRRHNILPKDLDGKKYKVLLRFMKNNNRLVPVM
jgi:hypothetical protein